MERSGAGVGAGDCGAARVRQAWTQPDVVPWAPGIRNLWIGISIRMISGRQVNALFVD